MQPNQYAGVDDFVRSFFKKDPTDLTYENARYQTYYPATAISGGGVNVIRFDIPQWQGRVFMDLADTLMAVQISLKKEDGTIDPPDNSIVAPVNNVLHSVFSCVNIYYNNTLMTSNGNNYGYKKYLQTLLSYNPIVKTSALEASGFYMDTVDQFNKIDKDNLPLMQRMKHFCTVNDSPTSTEKVTSDFHAAWFIGRFGCDMDGPVPNGVNVRIEFTMADPKFFLMAKAGTKFTYKINKMMLLVPTRTLTAPVLERVEKLFKTSDIVQSFRRFEVTPFTINSGTSQYLSENLFPAQSLVPARCIFALVKQDDFQGDMTRNPYKFKSEFATSVASSKYSTAPYLADLFVLYTCPFCVVGYRTVHAIIYSPLQKKPLLKR